MHSKLRWLGVISWLLLSAVLAQEPSPTPVIRPVPRPTPVDFPSPTPTPPIPTPTVPPSVPDLRPAATFTFADGTKITTRRTTGRFPLVALHPNEVVDVAMQFPAVLPNTPLTAQSLDGGTVTSFSRSSGGSGSLASIRFRAGARPGLYRVVVPGLGGSALLQFWVIDPNNPKAKPPVLNPGH